MKISGNDLFVTAMKKEGVDTIFAYPGGMVVNLLDALHDCHSIDLVLPRHEQGLIHAADGYARATGKVGVCLVTSGPGATNLVQESPRPTTTVFRWSVLPARWRRT